MGERKTAHKTELSQGQYSQVRGQSRAAQKAPQYSSVQNQPKTFNVPQDSHIKTSLSVKVLGKLTQKIDHH